MAHGCLAASLFTEVSAFAIPLAAAMTAVKVNARRYFIADIALVGSKCWIVMALCPEGQEAKNGCSRQPVTAIDHAAADNLPRALER
jgi:hypothetical protein